MAVEHPAAVLALFFTNYCYLSVMKISITGILLLLLLHAGVPSRESGELALELLPAMNTPRAGHHAVMLGDELTVFGGHTDGFVPLRTAEYFSGGQWHEVPMTYAHDFGFAVPLPDGKVMLGGGSKEEFGIGRSFGVEIYDPAEHAFSSLGVLDRARAGVSAFAFPDGRVVVTGNWYAPDAIEIYEPGKGFRFLKDVSAHRCRPYIFQSGPEDLIIFGSQSNYGASVGGTVDRLCGDSFTEPLLDEWAVCLPGYAVFDNCRIGNYSYLVPSLRRSDSAPGIIKVSAGQFSLLEMEQPLPVAGQDSAVIAWIQRLQVDRPSRTAWMQGRDENGVQYVARIDYNPTLDGGKATLKLYSCPELLPLSGGGLLAPDGRLIFTGGTSLSGEAPSAENNFATRADVYVLSLERSKPGTSVPWWPFVLAAALLVMLLPVLLRKKDAPEDPVPPVRGKAEGTDLMSRIRALMEQEHIFRNPALRIGDVAAALGSNSTYVSACINGQYGSSFTDFVTEYRVNYACTLMRTRPGMKSAEVAMESGFSSERSFFRSFKAVTGLSPSEWRSSEAGRL